MAADTPEIGGQSESERKRMEKLHGAATNPKRSCVSYTTADRTELTSISKDQRSISQGKGPVSQDLTISNLHVADNVAPK